MRKAIIVAAAIILMVIGVVLVNARNHSAAPSSSQATTTFELMSKTKNLPVAPILTRSDNDVSACRKASVTAPPGMPQ